MDIIEIATLIVIGLIVIGLVVIGLVVIGLLIHQQITVINPNL